MQPNTLSVRERCTNRVSSLATDTLPQLAALLAMLPRFHFLVSYTLYPYEYSTLTCASSLRLLYMKRLSGALLPSVSGEGGGGGGGGGGRFIQS